MTTEDEMMNLILAFAKTDDRIRVVGMEGSRTNKNIVSDHFQDYDITYIVTDMKPFIENEEWLDLFGERVFMQKPEDMSLYLPELGNWFSYLMLLKMAIA
jgi:Streptomycin adenylyltransferase.